MADHFQSARAGLDSIAAGGRGTALYAVYPAAKFATAFAFIVCVVSTGSISQLAAFAVYPIITVSFAGTRLKRLFIPIAAAMPFVFFIGLSNLFWAKDAVFTLCGWTVTRGMMLFALLLLKTALTVSACILLAYSMPFTEIAAFVTAPAYLRPFGLPLIITFRYIAALLEEADAMRRAYSLRSPKLKALHIRHTGSFFGTLLLRGFDREERVYAAMKCRGFDGVFRVMHNSNRKPAYSFLYAGLWITVFIIFKLVNMPVLLGRIFL